MSDTAERRSFHSTSMLVRAAGSGARSTGDADRVGALGGAAGPPGTVPSGAILRKAVDAHLTRAGLDSAGHSGSVSLRLPTKQCAGVGFRLARPLPGWGGCVSVGVSRLDADRDRTVAPAARLALRVGLRVGVGLALSLLQTSAFAKRRAGLAVAHLADVSSCMSDRLLLLRRGLRCVGGSGRVRGGTRRSALWCSGNRMLDHGEPSIAAGTRRPTSWRRGTRDELPHSLPVTGPSC